MCYSGRMEHLLGAFAAGLGVGFYWLLFEYIERQQAEIERQQRACDHVYVGKQFEARGGFFGLRNQYIVVGVSPQSQQVTIRSRNSDYRQEITCSDIPN